MKAVSKKSQGRNFCTLAAHNHKDPQRSTKIHKGTSKQCFRGFKGTVLVVQLGCCHKATKLRNIILDMRGDRDVRMEDIVRMRCDMRRYLSRQDGRDGNWSGTVGCIGMWCRWVTPGGVLSDLTILSHLVLAA